MAPMFMLPLNSSALNGAWGNDTRERYQGNNIPLWRFISSAHSFVNSSDDSNCSPIEQWNTAYQTLIFNLKPSSNQCSQKYQNSSQQWWHLLCWFKHTFSISKVSVHIKHLHSLILHDLSQHQHTFRLELVHEHWRCTWGTHRCAILMKMHNARTAESAKNRTPIYLLEPNNNLSNYPIRSRILILDDWKPLKLSTTTILLISGPWGPIPSSTAPILHAHAEGRPQSPSARARAAGWRGLEFYSTLL